MDFNTSINNEKEDMTDLKNKIKIQKEEIGKKYNLLTIIDIERKKIGKENHFRNIAICKCDCKNPKLFEVRLDSLKKGDIKSCGCLRCDEKYKYREKLEKEFIGKKYGSLTIVDFITKNKNVYAYCKCDCNDNISLKKFSEVRTGVIKTCGRFHIFNIKRKKEIGKKYGYLIIKDLILEKGHKCKEVFAICDCDYCKKSKNVKHNFAQIKCGNIKSCGCYNYRKGKEKNGYKDLTGKDFGLWTVMYDTGKRKHGSPVWHCICKCEKHTEKEITSSTLLRGASTSCGCKNSNNTNYGALKKIYSGRLIKTNTSGINGVWWDNKRKKWVVRIEIQKKKINLGGYETKTEAYLVRKEANEKYILPLLEQKYTIEEIENMIKEELKQKYIGKKINYSDSKGINTMDIKIAEDFNSLAQNK